MCLAGPVQRVLISSFVLNDKTVSADLLENCLTQHVDGAFKRSISKDSGPDENMVGAMLLLIILGNVREEITELCPFR